MPYILWNYQIPYVSNNSLPVARILKQINPAKFLSSHFLQIHSSNNLSSTSLSFMRSTKFFNQNPVRISPFPILSFNGVCLSPLNNRTANCTFRKVVGSHRLHQSVLSYPKCQLVSRHTVYFEVCSQREYSLP